jgi:hypothetical protein
MKEKRAGQENHLPQRLETITPQFTILPEGFFFFFKTATTTFRAKGQSTHAFIRNSLYIQDNGSRVSLNTKDGESGMIHN